ncbi:MAG: hypothetical protein IT258_20575 [Saprospiraceae bacterium]|nr:hypothetical protein [Saprospiraceae bacterium]
MKENLHNDKLEEFLRKSLEGHSEDPPGDLWSKIAANIDLPAADAPSAAPTQFKPRLRALRNWWSVAAAAAVFTGLLIGQHLYFHGKIDHLNKALEQNATQLKELEQKRLVEQQKNEVLPIENSIDNQAGAQNVTTTESQLPSSLQNDLEQQKQPKAQEAAKAPSSQLTKEKKQKNGTDGAVPPPAVAAQNGKSQKEEPKAGAKNNASDLAEHKDKSTDIKSEQSNQTPAPSEVGALTGNTSEQQQAGLPLTWGRKLLPLKTPALQAPSISNIVPAFAQTSRRFSVGLQAMPMLTKASVKEVREHDEGPGNPNNPGGPDPFDEHKSFTAKDTTSFKSWMTGLAFEAQITPRLRLGTGLAYRTYDNETTHEICFDFKDREPHHGNQHEYDFAYNLNTAAGAVEMTVRAESDDPAFNISDTAKVEAVLKTSERLAFASVPLYANYSFGKGRLRFLAKAGLVFNILLDKDFNIQDIDSQNNQFRFDRQKPQHGSPADLQNLTASYMAGIGLEYQLTKSLSLRAEPTVMGSISGLHNNPFIESSEFSAGLNVGMMYSF